MGERLKLEKCSTERMDNRDHKSKQKKPEKCKVKKVLQGQLQETQKYKTTESKRDGKGQGKKP